jgi:electron transfer flavoprotein-quinone oxidoreductase
MSEHDGRPGPSTGAPLVGDEEIDPVGPFDAIVVGAGPAGAAAGLALARAGRSVIMVERGPFPGSKNVYGGVVYGRVLDAIIPRWWEEVPVERWVVRRSTMMMTDTQSLSVDFRSQAWGSAPFNGMTTLRSAFDSWLADKAVAAGARILTSTVATGLVRDPVGRVVGVRTDRSGGELRAPVVIACDGVNSFLGKEAGLVSPVDAAHYTLGVKEVLDLPPTVIDERFGVGRHEGVDIEMLGCTGGLPGGGFLYTNADTVSVGVVVSLPALAEAKVRPEELIADLKEHPSIAPLLRGAALREYAAHLIPEGGYDTMPTLAADGLVLAGDAAAMTLAAGLWLEGVNFAIGSGYAAGQAVDRAIRSGDCSTEGLASYRTGLERQFVLADHRRLRRAPALLLSDRVQRRYPGLLCDLAEGMFTVENPTPKPGGLRITRQAAAKHGVKLRQLAADTLRGMRIFG